MSNANGKAVSSYRRRMKRRGVVRLEVQDRLDDVVFVRRMAKAHVDSEHGDGARAFLRERFGVLPPSGLKALLAAAPLDGVDLDRERDSGRDIATCRSPTTP